MCPGMDYFDRRNRMLLLEMRNVSISYVVLLKTTCAGGVSTRLAAPASSATHGCWNIITTPTVIGTTALILSTSIPRSIISIPFIVRSVGTRGTFSSDSPTNPRTSPRLLRCRPHPICDSQSTTDHRSTWREHDRSSAHRPACTGLQFPSLRPRRQTTPAVVNGW